MTKENKLETRRDQERKRLLDLVKKRPLHDEKLEQGVLLSDAIKEYATKFSLIVPFEERNLKPACYKLTIGDEYCVNGQIYQISDKPPNNIVKIPPFEVAIIKTRETLNLPRFLIGRWNIQVTRAYQGLIWVGGPQVDAGWVGNLCCPIYNLSDQEVLLRYADSIAVIDFEKTTGFNEDRSKPYLDEGHVPDRVLFEDYHPERLKSALSTFVTDRIKVFKNQVDSLQLRVDQFVSITFTVVGVLFAAVALFFGRPDTPNWWDPGLLWICVISIFMSMLAWINSKSAFQWFRGALKIVFEFILLAILTAATFIYISHNQRNVNELEKQIDQLQKKVEELDKKPQQSQTPPVSDRPALKRSPQTK